MMYAQPLTWKHPRFVQNRRLNRQRGRYCPRSDFFTFDFDVAKHQKEYDQLRSEHKARKEDAEKYAEVIHNAEVRADNEFRAGRGNHRLPPARVRSTARSVEVPVTEIRQGFPSVVKVKEFADSRGVVLANETIWASKSEQAPKPIAEWPGNQEMKFEGDDRMRTDKLHRRFLPLPRQPANETVMWSQRPVVQFYELDERHRPLSDEDVVFLHNKVEGEEVDEEEARLVLGEELLSLLDPVGVL